MDLIHLIEAEHRHIERLFERFERTARGAEGRQESELAREILRELSIHASVEEQVLYPALQRAGASAERLDALEDHHAVKRILAELRVMTPANERFVAKMHFVEKSTRQHIEQEEAMLLPHLREALPPEELQRLGAEFESLRRSAPTRPHPASPDTPPVNFVTNAVASVVDRFLDALQDARGLFRQTAGQLAMSAARAGRDAADRTRRNSKALAEQARETGERALERTRVLGVEVLQGAAETGQEAASRIEQRAATAARELDRHGARTAGVRARRAHPAKPRGRTRRRSAQHR